MLLTENNIKAELSYAYLHAVASRAGCEAVVAGRHSDGAGVDATIRARERFAPDSIFTDFTIDVQLKATSEEPLQDELGRYPFSLRLDHYDKLRDPGRTVRTDSRCAVSAKRRCSLAHPLDRWLNRPPLWLLGEPEGGSRIREQNLEDGVCSLSEPLLRLRPAIHHDAGLEGRNDPL